MGALVVSRENRSLRRGNVFFIPVVGIEPGMQAFRRFSFGLVQG